jgi:ABC-type Fe3+-hydroxamate transport system substrate-binding protein
MIVTDHIGHSFEWHNNIPLRIISVVPSQTELLWNLGLDEEVIGITKFCVHPNEWFRNKTRIGGTKNLNIEKIRLLQPTLIIANKEENNKADIETLQAEFNVWTSDIATLSDAYKMIADIGALVNREALALELISNVKTQMIKPLIEPKTALYAIWYNPWMFAGKQTFIDDMLGHAGMQNVLTKERYPSLSPQEIKDLNPKVILLSSEPFPFKDKHMAELQALLPNAQIKLVDGEMFSWYGSRLLFAGKYFEQLLHNLSV